MKNKKVKGQYGYRDYHKKILTAEVAFGAVMIIAQLLARSFTDNQAAKNVLTLMAILSVLPTANVASPWIASWKYKTAAPEFYKSVSGYGDRALLLYDLILTSRDFILPADAAAVHAQGVFLFCSSQKADAQKAEKFLADTFSAYEIHLPVKVIKEEKAFFRRLESLKPPMESGSFEETASKTAKILMSLSM